MRTGLFLFGAAIISIHNGCTYATFATSHEQGEGSSCNLRELRRPIKSSNFEEALLESKQIATFTTVEGLKSPVMKENLSSKQVIELENTYGAHKYYLASYGRSPS